MICNSFPQILVVVSPFIGDFKTNTHSLKQIIDRIDKNQIITYVVTREPKEEYQRISIEKIRQCPSVEIRYNDDIHAKLYVCWCKKEEAESFALFGSGNLTFGGIQRNLEIGMMLYSRDEGQALVRQLYDWSTQVLRTQSIRVKPRIR